MSSSLENKNGNWVGFSMASQWTIPLTGERGIVINNYGYVLGINAVTSGTDAALQDQNNPPSSGQIWLRGTSDDFGYFTLQNPASQKFLTLSNTNRNSITIEGTLTVKVFILGGLFMK